MKPMIWHPEEIDEKVNRYLEQSNHAPYAIIAGLMLGLLCLFMVFFVMGSF